MEWNRPGAFSAPLPTRLTTRQRQIFSALTAEWKCARQLASDAGIVTSSPHESARIYANQLVRMHFAEKGGTHAHPFWRQPHIVRTIVK